MIILHKDGNMVEVAAIERIRPLQINSATGRRAVEIRFYSGICDIYEDVWHTKTKLGVSIYDALLPEKMVIDWRETIRS